VLKQDAVQVVCIEALSVIYASVRLESVVSSCVLAGDDARQSVAATLVAHDLGISDGHFYWH
jgi:hypothetical protein